MTKEKCDQLRDEKREQLCSEIRNIQQLIDAGKIAAQVGAKAAIA